MSNGLKRQIRLSLLIFALFFTVDLSAQPAPPKAGRTVVAPASFVPPAESTIPHNFFGKTIILGKYIFDHTAVVAPDYVGNHLTCGNCHLDSGRKAYSAPMWGAYPMYPAYQSKNKQVETLEMRIQNCFYYSMNGKKPPLDSHLMVALSSYMYWLSTGAPTDVALAGRGYPKIGPPSQKPDPKTGAVLYKARCAQCHGENGEGLKVSTQHKPEHKLEAGEKYIFPPLWGNGSYNWGAGMHTLNLAAGFILGNMPYHQDFTLTDQEAWDLAAFINSQPRPQDPRFNGNIAETKAKFHQHDCLYGDTIDGHLIGKGFLHKK